jgi:hypothetical protein
LGCLTGFVLAFIPAIIFMAYTMRKVKRFKY